MLVVLCVKIIKLFKYNDIMLIFNILYVNISTPNIGLKMLYILKIRGFQIKIILLGIISIVCIARTSGKTDSGLQTTMRSCSVPS